jgi:hypothetical protein
MTRTNKARPLATRLRHAAPEAIELAAAALQPVLMAAWPTPEGGVATGVAIRAVADMAKRMMSVKEQSRVELVLSLAKQRIEEHIAANGPGTAPRAEEMGSLVEGTLLAAKEAFEEQKVPLMANLLATAPFTNTPITNLVGTLQLLESLTYRQICILSLIPGYFPDRRPRLTEKTIAMLLSEAALDEGNQGILHDVIQIVGQNLAGQVRGGGFLDGVPSGDLVPAELALTYPALILVNGTRASATIPDADLVAIRAVLSS